MIIHPIRETLENSPLCGHQMGRWQPLDVCGARLRKVEDLAKDLCPAVDDHRLTMMMMITQPFSLEIIILHQLNKQ